MNPTKCELYPTMITPFHADGSIDYESIDRLMNLFAANQCDGVFAVCQSSEMFYLTPEEKVRLARFCVDRCRRLGMKCVVSGHTEDSAPEQIRCLRQMESARADALILVLNRFAAPEEDDGVLIGRLKAVIGELDPHTRLGIYECPYPYKRLLTPRVIDFLMETGRFDFIKDTSCDIRKIRDRIAQLKGSSIRLFNANAATLAESLAAGAAGYSGVMLNMVPELFRCLKAAADHNHTLEQIASRITLYSVYEYQNYPVNAKYLLRCRGIIEDDYTRKEHAPLTESQQKEIRQLLRSSECDYAKMNPLPGRELIFEAGRYFPSCHASTILALGDGTVLVAYFAGLREGADDVGIWLSRRVNGRWLPPECIAKDEDTAHWNPVLFQTDKGIRLVYRVGKNVPEWKCRTRTSADAGKTWSCTRPYPAPDDTCGPVRSKPIVLSNHTLLAPDSVETADDWQPRVDISTDQGFTFSVLARIPVNHTHPDRANYIEGRGAIQPTLWESTPGHVHALLRTTGGFIFRSDSDDFGKTWCEAYSTGIPNNNSGIEIAQDRGCLYLICNPIPGNWAARTPIVIKKSDDNGASFTDFCSLDTDDFDRQTKLSAEFSYPSAVVRGGKLYVAYTYFRRQMAFCEIDL